MRAEEDMNTCGDGKGETDVWRKRCADEVKERGKNKSTGNGK